ANNRTYDGTEKPLVTVTGEATGGTMVYALGENATTAPAAEQYTTSIPTATDAGTYYVWYMVKGDNTHNDTKAASVKVSIAKRRVTLTSGTATKVYDGKALKNNKVTVSGDGWAKGEGATYKVTGSQTKVGKSNNKFSYTLKSGTDAKNYNIVTKTGTLTVTEPVERGTFIHIKSITQKNNKLQINWTKVGQADGYDVYVQYCTKNFADPVKTIKKNATTQLTIAKLNGKKIDLTKAFKIYVSAYKMVNGKKTVLAKTVTSHVVGVKNAKYTNQKALKLTKNAFDIKAGKTAKIKVSATLVDGKKKIIPKDHGAAFKFRSSNTRVATVDKDGKITAKKTGKCYIFVYGISGLMKKVTVTVK
ncbi:MAG: Ig-like domain-containing protein, partial [Eubacterium sp.]|nr:Ig-like domain-containing protein [Eubacterium sp.]